MRLECGVVIMSGLRLSYCPEAIAWQEQSPSEMQLRFCDIADPQFRLGHSE